MLVLPRPEIPLALPHFLFGVPFSFVSGLMAVAVQAAFHLASELRSHGNTTCRAAHCACASEAREPACTVALLVELEPFVTVPGPTLAGKRPNIDRN